MKVLSGQEDFSEHPYDRQYKSLHCRMEPLDPDHAHFKVRRVHPMRQPGCSDPPPPRRWWRPTCSRRTDTRTASTPCLCLTCSQWTRREKRRDSRTLATGGPHMVCRHFPIMQGTAPPPPPGCCCGMALVSPTVWAYSAKVSVWPLPRPPSLATWSVATHSSV